MIEVSVVGDVGRMTLVGEFDIVNADEIPYMASALAQGVARSLEVDMAGVTFLGATALDALVVTSRLFDGRLTVTRPSVDLRYLFDVTGLSPLLGWDGTADGWETVGQPGRDAAEVAAT